MTDNSEAPQTAAEVPADWRRMRFRRNKVWMALGPDGEPLVREGKVLIKYQRDQDYEYWVHRAGVSPLDAEYAEDPAPAGRKKKPPRRPDNGSALHEAGGDGGGALMVYTDGASSGNPGPAGIGVLLQYGRREKKISRFIGKATNNVAELKAILAGLRAVKNKRLPVRVFTDSNYAYGLLVLGWKAKANTALVRTIKEEMSGFGNLQIVKIKGHAGHAGNECADRLATAAIRSAGGQPAG